jgi:N-dimethylarginine dimethylaminohydrolase
VTEPEPEPGSLAWGRRFLMCPPHHFGVLYEINPWMHRQVQVDHERALGQWQGLVDTRRAAGAEVVVMEPPPEEPEGPHVPDLVFTANAGVVNGGQFVPSHFRHPERQPETEVDAAWFAARGWQVDRLPLDLRHEGAGDALPFTPAGGRTVLLSGYSFRSDARAASELSRLLACPTRPVQLVDPRLYHLDLTFCPLDDRRAIVAPSGWDAYGRRVVEALVPEPLVLEPEEALAFCANSVVVGTTVVMPAVPVRVGRELEARGFTPVEARVDEFLKAGGGCRCLTLALDVRLSPRAPVAPVGPTASSQGTSAPTAGPAQD